MGGTILKISGGEIFIWTVFREKTFTFIKVHEDNIKQKILDEDKRAMFKINQDYGLGGFKEAKLRNYKRLSQIIGTNIDLKEVLLNESELISKIKQELCDLKKQYYPEYVGVPIGIGNHVDHIIVREVALAVFSANSVIFFYEDMPYSVNKEWYQNGIKYMLARYLLIEQRIYMTEKFEGKKRLIECYQSQITKRDQRLMYKYFGACSDELGMYERYWIMNKL